MRISTKRILSIIFSGVFFIGAIYMFTGPVQDEMKTINDQRAKLATQQSLYASQSQAIAQVQKLISSFQGTSNIQSSISFAIPNGEQAVSALRQVEAIGSAANITFSSVKFKSTAPRVTAQQFLKKLGVLEVTIAASGDYANLKDFMRKLETTVRIANVKEYSFHPGLLRNAKDSVEITVEMYYQM